MCRGVYCQQGTIMIRVNSRSLRKIREVEKMNFPAGFFNRPATKVRRNYYYYVLVCCRNSVFNNVIIIYYYYYINIITLINYINIHTNTPHTLTRMLSFSQSRGVHYRLRVLLFFIKTVLSSYTLLKDVLSFRFQVLRGRTSS